MGVTCYNIFNTKGERSVAKLCMKDCISDSSMLLCVQEELTIYISRVLEQEKQKWSEGKEPTTEDGCFVSTVAYDIIQVQNLYDDMMLKQL